MYDFFLDLTNFATIYSVYATVFISFALQYIWTLQTDGQFVESVCATTDLSYEMNQCGVLNRLATHRHPTILWIIRFVRRKLEQLDEASIGLIS